MAKARFADFAIGQAFVFLEHVRHGDGCLTFPVDATCTKTGPTGFQNELFGILEADPEEKVLTEYHPAPRWFNSRTVNG